MFKCKLMLFRCTMDMCLNTACVYLLAFLRFYLNFVCKRDSGSFTFSCIFFIVPRDFSTFIGKRSLSLFNVCIHLCLKRCSV